MIRKNKKTDLASRPAASAPEHSLSERTSSDWFLDMDRWFDDLRDEFEQKFWGPLAPLGVQRGPTARRPLSDLADNGREYVLRAELPGVSKEDLDIRVTPRGIEIAAQSRREKEPDYTYRERTYSSFRRSLDFPEEVLAEQAEAKLNDGVLEVRLPKKEPTPRREPVNVRVE